MPNLHVTDRQVMLYMTRSQQHDQESAAAMAGFSARTARRIDKDPRLPSQKRQPRTWRTRTDPLTDVWPRVLEMLKIPGMMAVTIFEDLQDEVGPEFFQTASAGLSSVASQDGAPCTARIRRSTSPNATILAARR